MRIADMNWMQVERYLKDDDRCVLPIGSTEQHAQLSLCVDMILAEKVAVEAAEPLGVPVYPAIPFGIAPYFAAFPGSVTLRVETLLAVARDLIASFRRSGFRRVLLVNGHGGNQPVAALAQELMADWPEMSIRWHQWWNAPRTWAEVQRIDPLCIHASWLENFPWTRLDGVQMPDTEKTGLDFDHLDLLDPAALREYLGEGNFGGRFQRPDADMHAIWEVAVAETRALLDGGWAR